MNRDDRGKSLSHLNEEGGIRMVDVGAKGVTRREAIAGAVVRMSAETLALVQRMALPKGDVLNTAKVAGILAAKQTSSLIPLTHPLPLDLVEIELTVDSRESAIRIRSVVRCQGRTGAEMEALTAAAVAALTIYDMCKSAEHGISIDELQLIQKSGGKSGTWKKTKAKPGTQNAER